jgi:hypothetical protein
MERGLRAKMKVYNDSDFFDNEFTSYLSFEDEEIEEFNPDAFRDTITDEEINDLFGVSENKKDSQINSDLDELIKYWKSSLPEKVDYAEMVGAEPVHYGHSYVYEDPDGYFIEYTIAALEELKDTRKFVSEIGKEIKKLKETSEKHLKEAELLAEKSEKLLETN